MKGQLNSHGSRISFTKLVVSLIKILSGNWWCNYYFETSLFFLHPLLSVERFLHCDLPMSLFPGHYLKSSSASSSTDRDCSSSKEIADADIFAPTAEYKGIRQSD